MVESTVVNVMDEPTLITKFRQGDRAAFEQIVDQHQGLVYGYLRARLLQTTDAEDLVQEVFLRLYVTRNRFDPDQQLRPWLLGIARNLLREHLRKVNRRKEVAWTSMCLELEELIQCRIGDEGEEALNQLPTCLDTLVPSAREAIQMKYRKNLRLSDIGEKLHRSEGAIKLLMYRARQALKNCLNGKNGKHRKAGMDTND